MGRPIQQIEVEVVLQTRRFQDLVGVLLDLSRLGFLYCGRWLQEAVFLQTRILLIEMHDLLGVRVALERFPKDLLRKQRFVSIDSLRFQHVTGVLLLLRSVGHKHVVGVAANL